MNFTRIVLLISFIVFFTSASYAQMYKWKDKNDVWVFSNIAPAADALETAQTNQEIQLTEPASKTDNSYNKTKKNKPYVKSKVQKSRDKESKKYNCKKQLKHYKSELSAYKDRLEDAKSNLKTPKTVAEHKKYARQKFKIDELESSVKYYKDLVNEYKKKCN